MIASTVYHQVRGDWVETGVWRGGNSINARAMQNLFRKMVSYADGSGSPVDMYGSDRRTYVCDSFQGIPPPSHEEDAGDEGWAHTFLAIPLYDVVDAFKRVGQLDSGVYFVRGFFRDSLPVLREHMIKQDRMIAVLYADGDLFESFYDILYNLYDRVSVGGWVVIDDIFPFSMEAVERFRRDHGILEDHPLRMLRADQVPTGPIMWQKTREVPTRWDKYEQFNNARSKTEIMTHTKHGDATAAGSQGYPQVAIMNGGGNLL